MNASVQVVLLLTVALALLVATLRMVLWRLLVGMSFAAARLPRLQGSRAWARMRPIQAWLSLRHPRLYAHLGARFDRSTFAGLPRTMLVVAAIYVVALLSGLTEEVVEAGGVCVSTRRSTQPLQHGASRRSWLSSFGLPFSGQDPRSRRSR